MTILFNKLERYMRCLYALCTVARSDPTSQLVSDSTRLLEIFDAFTPAKYREFRTAFKGAGFGTLVTRNPNGGRKKSGRNDWKVEISSIETSIAVLLKYISIKNHKVVRQMSYAMHNLPLAILMNDREYWTEFSTSQLLRESTAGNVVAAWE